MTFGVSIGPVPIPFGRVWGIVLHRVFPDWQAVAQDWPQNEVGIVWQLRLPRVILGAIVGAGLMMAGAAIQSLVRNSLADPYLLGISSGGCAGAVAAILLLGKVLGSSYTGLSTVFIMAFLGSLLAFGLVLLIAAQGEGLTPMRMILSGLAVSYMFTALTNFMVYLNQRSGAESAMFWMLGGLGGGHHEHHHHHWDDDGPGFGGFGGGGFGGFGGGGDDFGGGGGDFDFGGGDFGGGGDDF